MPDRKTTPFREYFEDKTGVGFPGAVGERHDLVMERLCNVAADFLDDLAKDKSDEAKG